MARDSMRASPMKRVRVTLSAASGCRAIASRAATTARPSLRAGAMAPTAMVSPATDIATMAKIVAASICVSSVSQRLIGVFASYDRAQIHHDQDGKDVGLHHADEHVECNDRDRNEETRDEQEDGDDKLLAHHVAKEAD